jgi:hypothetical protein
VAEPRLRSGLWVQVQLRLCDLDALPIAVVHTGDDQAGAVILKLNRLAAGCHVYVRTVGADGGAAWLAALGPMPSPEAEVDAYVRRALENDPDAWVLEIEDRDGRYALDAPVV